MPSRYSSLAEHLRGQGRDSVRVIFKDIDRMVGGLPDAAWKHRAWWANSMGFTHARHGWLAAGWRTAEVDMENQRLIFVRALPSPQSPPRGCLCGCGGDPGGADFLPGHDHRVRAEMERSAGGLANLTRVVRAIDAYVSGEYSDADLLRSIRSHWRRPGPAGPASDPIPQAVGPNPYPQMPPDLRASRMERMRAVAEQLDSTRRDRRAQVTERLLKISRGLGVGDLLPSLLPEASAFARENAYAFCLATCLDRQMSADVVWTIPYYMMQELGHLDPAKIGAMTIDELTALFGRLPRKPRFVNDAPATVLGVTRIILDEFDGDAAGIWRGRSAAEVRSTFRRVHGVGPGIANMAVLLIEKVFGVKFNDLDHASMDIKPDVHTVRVLYRLGVSAAESAEAAISAARSLNPSYPGEIDGALWRIGRGWCHAISPECTNCPMNDLCARVGISIGVPAP